MSDLAEQKACKLFSISSVEAITSQDDNNFRLLVGGSLIGLNQKDQRDRTTSVDVMRARIKDNKKLEKDNQTYEGTVFFNNIHGNGFYFINEEGAKTFYDGLFYLNKLEGYGQIFYERGQHFQGLFKKHKRYGPGILTYSSHTQDVGIWEGFYLIRLLTVAFSDVPTLAHNSSGKAKLLRYKYMIPLMDERPNYAKELLEELNIPDPLGIKARSLLSSKITHEDSVFFQKQLYDENFLENFFQSIQKFTIEVISEGEDEENMEEAFDADGNPRKTSRSCQTNLRYIEVKRKLAEVVPLHEQYYDLRETLLTKIEYCKQCCHQPVVEEPAEETNKEPLPDEPEPTANVARISYISTLSNFSYRSSGTARYNTTPNYSDHNISTTAASNEPSYHPSSHPDSEPQEIPVPYEEEPCLCPEELNIDLINLENLEDELREVSKQEWFYKSIVESLTQKLEQDEKREDDENKYFHKTRKVSISEMLSWNNESKIMDIQKHCFAHRYSEYMVTFNVAEFLKGNRNDFYKPGEQEEMCKEFLTACCQGNKELVGEILLNDKINVNVTDGRGNSGIFFAAINNRLDIIPILVNYGAKLDQVNDEGLTPLSMCILKYLAVRYKVTDWEKAFLSEIDSASTENISKWYDVKSFLSLLTQSSETCINNQNDCLLENVSNPRLIDLLNKLSDIKVQPPTRSKDGTFVFDLTYKTSNPLEKNPPKESSINSLDRTMQEDLTQLNLTIMALLEYGSDPNIGDVPQPILMSALFTENLNLVKRLIKSNADYTVRLSDDKLTCLHVMAALPTTDKNIEICEALLENQCNPNLRTSPDHWSNQIPYFTGKIPEDFEIENLGKYPLHLLCMRNDFENDSINGFEQLARLLIIHGANVQDTYLGHTALSLAVLIGNQPLVKFLILENLVDPYELLPYEMGNVLTLYTLKRFENVLPIAKCKEMFEMFFEINMNFLNRIGEFENAIDFADRTEDLSKMKNLDEEETKTTRKGKQKEKKKKVKPEKSAFLNTLKEFMKDLARKAIIKFIQLKSVKILYDFAEEQILNQEDFAVYMAEFLTSNLAITNLKLLLDNKKIENDRFNLEVAETMVQFVEEHQKIVKTKKGKQETKQKSKDNKSKKDTKKSKKDSLKSEISVKSETPKQTTIHEQLENLTKAESNQQTKFLIEPSLDDQQKYRVCFNCLRSVKKELKLCPKCQMIYFCSTQCNKQGVKKKTLHICNLVFYENNLEEGTKSLADIARDVEENCKKRLLKAREDLQREEQEKMIKLWKADTYGTKFMQYQYILKKCPSTTHKMHIEDITKINFPLPSQRGSFLIEAHNRLSSISKCSRLESGYNITKVPVSDPQYDISEEKKQKRRIVKKKKCYCLERKVNRAQIDELVQDTVNIKSKYPPFKDHNQIPMKFDMLNRNFDIKDRGPVFKQLKKVPEKYHRFMEVLTTYFPGIDLSNWLLPYACCSEGQLYYKFCDNLFRDSYSFL